VLLNVKLQVTDRFSLHRCPPPVRALNNFLSGANLIMMPPYSL
jgi:hypothetical protein